MKEPIDKDVILGSLAVFTCTAIGTPSPTIQWTINDSPISDVPARYDTHGGVGVLTVFDVKESDEGIVTCVALIGNVSAQAHARLEVLGLLSRILLQEFSCSLFVCLFMWFAC